ncbi:MAG: BamA/TamA family outer membrane protein, partial [Candidatus Acidiferrales bacterium]
DRDLVQEGKRNLVSYFQSKGYFDVTVDTSVNEQPGHISIVYEVDKGHKHKIESVAFQGNHCFADDDLRPLIKIHKARLFSRGRLSNDLLRTSTNVITSLYRDAGFADVKVQSKVEDHEPEVDVTFLIAEGQQTLVNSLNIEGNAHEPVAALSGRGLQLSPGNPYSPHHLEQDRNQILAVYLNNGYLNARFQPQVSPLASNPHRVDVVYKIDEGPQAHVADVVLLGGRTTRRSLIDRVVNIQQGEPLSESKLLGAETSLYDLGIFDWTDVGPRRAIIDQQQEDVLVKLHESKRNTLDYGVGFEVTHRGGNLPIGAVALPGLPVVGLGSKFQPSEKVFVGPRGSFEYVRHNLRGRAETFSVGALVSRLDQRGSATYGDPHFPGWNWASLLSVSAERTTENPIFTARFGEGSFQLQKTLDPARTKTLLFRYSFRRTILTNILIPDLVLPQDRAIRLSSVSASLVRDTRDKPLDAHKGIYQSVNFSVTPKVFGSQANFVRLLGQTAYYLPLTPWLTWANNVRVGLAKPFAGSDVPLSERFFSGGSNTLRGFPINGAGPQRPVNVCSNPADPSTCTLISVPVGGNMLFVFNSEARFPIPIKSGLGGVIFYDGGNVYSRINFNNLINNYTNTAGFGFRYDTPVGPLRIDIGHRLTTVPGVKSNQYFVTLGQSF